MRKESPGLGDRLKLKVKQALGMEVVLCDSCQWNWRNACNLPERHRAIWCPDYKKKGT
ncbi:MAG: hypothetical protein J7K94_04805 [Dehalococcoidia bacterium]|nr:hypothetical protein [Dehalococcoidia bacterium]